MVKHFKNYLRLLTVILLSLGCNSVDPVKPESGLSEFEEALVGNWQYVTVNVRGTTYYHVDYYLEPGTKLVTTIGKRTELSRKYVNYSADKTYQLYRISFNHLRTLYGGRYSVLNFDRTVVDDLMEHFMKLGVKPGTYLRTLRAAFERLYFDEKIDRNPFWKFKLPRDRGEEKKKCLTMAELQAFLLFARENTDTDTYHLLRI